MRTFLRKRGVSALAQAELTKAVEEFEKLEKSSNGFRSLPGDYRVDNGDGTLSFYRRSGELFAHMNKEDFEAIARNFGAVT